MDENNGFVEGFLKKIQEAIDRGEVEPDIYVTVRHDVQDRYVRFLNVPHITYDDPKDPDWYYLPYSSEKVLVAYLKQPTISNNVDPITVEYDDVLNYVTELGLL